MSNYPYSFATALINSCKDIAEIKIIRDIFCDYKFQEIISRGELMKLVSFINYSDKRYNIFLNTLADNDICLPKNASSLIAITIMHKEYKTLIIECVNKFISLCSKDIGEQLIELITSKPLAELEKKEIFDYLSSMSNKKIFIFFLIKEEMNGGLIIKNGGFTLDMSLKMGIYNAMLAIERSLEKALQI